MNITCKVCGDALYGHTPEKCIARLSAQVERLRWLLLDVSENWGCRVTHEKAEEIKQALAAHAQIERMRIATWDGTGPKPACWRDCDVLHSVKEAPMAGGSICDVCAQTKPAAPTNAPKSMGEYLALTTEQKETLGKPPNAQENQP